MDNPPNEFILPERDKAKLHASLLYIERWDSILFIKMIDDDEKTPRRTMFKSIQTYYGADQMDWEF